MRRRSSVLILFALVGCAVLLAQSVLPQKTEVPDPGETVFSSETRLVSLNVSVVDKGGHLVTNLPQTAFTVLENGVAQPISHFKREDVPVSLGLVIDNSGSMRNKRRNVETSALALIQDSNPQDETFVVNFNDEAYLDGPDFTNDIKILEQSLTKIDARGGTAMRDALRMSIEHMVAKAKRDKKVILVVTDGHDNASALSLEGLVQLAQKNDIIIYSIALLSEEEKSEAKKAKRAIDLLTDSTGGQAYYPKESTDVEKTAHQVAHDIRNQYSIAYKPTNPALDDTFRQVKINVKPSSATARTRHGYYATDKAKKRG